MFALSDFTGQMELPSPRLQTGIKMTSDLCSGPVFSLETEPCLCSWLAALTGVYAEVRGASSPVSSVPVTQESTFGGLLYWDRHENRHYLRLSFQCHAFQ